MTGGILGWVSLVAERFAFGVKLKRVCKKKGYCLCENGKFWWLGRNGSGKYNFTVKCGDESYDFSKAISTLQSTLNTRINGMSYVSNKNWPSISYSKK